jgi:hypothetical protein
VACPAASGRGRGATISWVASAAIDGASRLARGIGVEVVEGLVQNLPRESDMTGKATIGVQCIKRR